MATTNLNIKITTNANEASSDLKQFSSQIANLNQPLMNLKKGLADLFLPISTLKSAYSLVDNQVKKYQAHIKELVDAYKPQWEAETKLASLLKNTDEQLGLNSESLIAYAKELQNCTTFSDETVISIESMLASTKAINEVNLKRATESVLDIATAMGTDAVGASKTLAEVLKKPADELNKLKGVGIDFTDEEKEKIKQLKEANDLFGAQELVLKKVADAYGGVAKAMADTPMGSREQLANLENETKQLNGQILALEEDANARSKLERVKKKNENLKAELMLKEASFDPTSLMKYSLEELKKVYEDYKDMELSPYVDEKTQIANIKNALDTKTEANNDDLLNRRGYSKDMYTQAVDRIGATVKLKIEPEDNKEKTKEELEKELEEWKKIAENAVAEAKKQLEAELKEKEDKIKVSISILDASSDAIGAWCDFASQIYSNQLTTLQNTLSAMTEQWDSYYNDLKEKHESEGESLVSEYALGRISAEEYFEAQQAMNDELAKAEEEQASAKEKAQAKLNEIEKKKFNADKANNIATATISMATGIMNAWTNPITAPIMTALIAATGIAQIATISAQQFTPSFASGAIVNKPTKALIGDSGYPEAIIPLNKAEDLGLSSKGGGDVYNITVNVENAYTSEDLALSVYESIEMLKKDGILKKETI